MTIYRLSFTQALGCALMLAACALVASVTAGLLVPCLQVLGVALVLSIAAALALRLVAARSVPPSQQIIDQPTTSNVPTDDADSVARQIEERRRRLERGE